MFVATTMLLNQEISVHTFIHQLYECCTVFKLQTSKKKQVKVTDPNDPWDLLFLLQCTKQLNIAVRKCPLTNIHFQLAIAWCLLVAIDNDTHYFHK